MIVFPEASWAVTVTLTAVPAVAVVGALTANLAPVEVMPAGLTVTLPEVPVVATVVVSFTVTVFVPAVLSVTAKVPVPPTSVASAGRTAAPSVEVKCTVPA